MNRTEHVKINIIFGITARIIAIILEFVSRALFIKTLGNELLGINGVFTNIIQMLSLAELGINNVAMYSFYKPIADNNNYKISALIRFYRKIYNVISLMIAITGILLLPFLDYLVNTTGNIEHLSYLYLLFLADSVFSYLFVYKGMLLKSAQKNYITTRYEIVMNTIRTTLQIVSLYIFKSFLIYLLIKVIMSIGTNFLIALRVDKEYSYLKQKSELDITTKQEIVITIKSGFIYKISAVLLNSTDNLLISVIVGTVWVGYLSNYITLINAVSSIIFIFFSSITASIGNLVVTEDENKRLEVFNLVFFIGGWIAIVCTSCMWILSDEFITLWIGKDYIMDRTVVAAKAGMMYLSCSMNPIFCYREALGLYQKTKYVMLLAAMINIFLSIVMGNIWGIAGILIASLISVITTYLWYEPYVMYKDYFGSHVKEYFIKLAKNFLLFITAVFIFSFGSNQWKVETWGSWILKAGLLFVGVNLYCYLFLHKCKEFTYVVRKFILKNN